MPHDKDLQLVAAKLDLISEKVASLKVPDKKETPPWYAVLTGALGVPALIIVMVLNFSQYQSNAFTTEKTVKETEKTQLEIEQLRTKSAELKAAVQSEDVQSLKRALQDTVPLLQRSAARLELQTGAPVLESGLWVRYIVVWVFMSFVTAAFSAFYVGWDVVSQLPYTISNWLRRRVNQQERQAGAQLALTLRDQADYDAQRKATEKLITAFERKRNRLEVWTLWSATAVRTLPRLFEVAVRVAIFAVLIMPMFDAVAEQRGSNVRFAHVLASARRLEVGKCLSYVRDLVAPPAGVRLTR